MSAAFPTYFPADRHEVLEKLREQWLFEAQALATGDDSLLHLAEGAEQVRLQMIAPVNMKPGPGHAGDALRRAFEQNCIALELKGISRPYELSAYEYYSRVAYLEQKKE